MWKNLRPTNVLLLGVLAATSLFAQPRFEGASVKPGTPGTDTGKIISLTGGQFSVENFPLRTMLLNGFNARSYEIVGIPAWVSSARYTITARAAGGVGADKMWPMMVTLLEDRFKMKWHRETRDQPVYNLSLVKSGKLPAPQSGDCSGIDPSQAPKRPAPGKKMLTTCGSTLMPLTPGGTEIYGGQVAMRTLASRLTDLMQRPVIDQTGFSGTFDLDLKFAVDESLPGLYGHTGAAATPSDLAGQPNIVTALRDQLGLKLEAGKGPVKVIVIDHLEKPAAN
jgi:uncharacterized protein (TIGR03435 family)